MFVFRTSDILRPSRRKTILLFIQASRLKLYYRNWTSKWKTHLLYSHLSNQTSMFHSEIQTFEVDVFILLCHHSGDCVCSCFRVTCHAIACCCRTGGLLACLSPRCVWHTLVPQEQSRQPSQVPVVRLSPTGGCPRLTRIAFVSVVEKKPQNPFFQNFSIFSKTFQNHVFQYKRCII